MCSPEVMLGATGPVTLAGALAQHNAEVLAGVVLVQLCLVVTICLIKVALQPGRYDKVSNRSTE